MTEQLRDRFVFARIAAQEYQSREMPERDAGSVEPESSLMNFGIWAPSSAGVFCRPFQETTRQY